MSQGTGPASPRDPDAGPRRIPRWLIGVVVIALVGGALLAISLGIDPAASGPSALPSASAQVSPVATPSTSSASSSPTAEPTPTPLPAPDDVVPVAARVEVLAEGLRIREFPGLDADVAARLGAGDVVYVLNTGGTRLPPTIADGYAWYPVQFLPGFTDWPAEPPAGSPDVVFGYIAAHSTAGDWLVEVMDPRCPESADIESLARITAWERASCLGDEQLTLEGTFGCGVCDSLAYPGIFEPGWLAHYLNPLSPLSPVGHVQEVGVEPIVLAFPPDVERADPELRGSVMRIVGHFNDPLSTECVLGDEGGVSDDSASEWYCRERFVVEEWEVIGTDPDYPAPP